MYVFTKNCFEFIKDALEGLEENYFTKKAGLFVNEEDTFDNHVYLDSKKPYAYSFFRMCGSPHASFAVNELPLTAVSYFDLCQNTVCAECFHGLRLNKIFNFWIDAFDTAYTLNSCKNRSSEVSFDTYVSTVFSLEKSLDVVLKDLDTLPNAGKDFPFSVFDLKKMFIAAVQSLQSRKDAAFNKKVEKYIADEILKMMHTKLASSTSSYLPLEVIRRFFESWCSLIRQKTQSLLENPEAFSIASEINVVSFAKKQAALSATLENACRSNKIAAKLKYQLGDSSFEKPIIFDKQNLPTYKSSMIQEFISLVSLWEKTASTHMQDAFSKKGIVVTASSLKDYPSTSSFIALTLFPSECFVSLDGKYFVFSAPYYVLDALETTNYYSLLGEKLSLDTDAVLETALSLLSSALNKDALVAARLALKV